MITLKTWGGGEADENMGRGRDNNIGNIGGWGRLYLWTNVPK